MRKKLKEKIVEESRHLVKINVYRNGNQWTFSTEGKSYVAICDEEGLVDLLRKLKAKDDKEEPRSFRSETYKQIAQEIIDGTDRTIYVWSTDLNSVWGKGSVIYKQEESKRMKKVIREMDNFMNGTKCGKNIKERTEPNFIVLDDYEDSSPLYKSTSEKDCIKWMNKNFDGEALYLYDVRKYIEGGYTDAYTNWSEVLKDERAIYVIRKKSDIKESYSPNIITIEKEFKIPGTNIVIEKGDKISIMKSKLDLKYCAKQLEKMFRSYDYDDFDIHIEKEQLFFKVEASTGFLNIVLNSNGKWKIHVLDFGCDSGPVDIINKGVGYEKLLKGIAEDDEGEFAFGWGFRMDYKKYL